MVPQSPVEVLSKQWTNEKENIASVSSVCSVLATSTSSFKGQNIIASPTKSYSIIIQNGPLTDRSWQVATLVYKAVVCGLTSDHILAEITFPINHDNARDKARLDRQDKDKGFPYAVRSNAWSILKSRTAPRRIR